MNSAIRAYVTAGVALVGTGVIAVTPITAPLPDVHVPDIQLTAGDEDIVIDIVRHGQRVAPFNHELIESPPYPGVPLSDLGQQQANAVGNQLFNELGGPHGVAGIFSGQGIRDVDTATPFATLEHMTTQPLPGLDEVDPGIYAQDPPSSPGAILDGLITAAWGFGLELVPMQGSHDLNGVVFDGKFTDAVDTMYDQAMANPVVSDNGEITDVAFNNEASVAAWTVMNVKNPDLSFFLHRLIEFAMSPREHPLLPNAGVVEVKGSPEDGWTLVNWNGHPISPDPGLATELFVDFRDLIIPPQTAAWHIFEAALTGDPTTIENALQAGIQNVGAAIAQFPESVINDITDALQNLGTDTGGQAAGETGATLSDAFSSLT
jgi:hypothetical protein